MNKNAFLRKFIATDVLASLLVWFAFVVYRKTINDISVIENFGIIMRNYDYFTSLIIFPVICVFIHYLTGVYINIHRKNTISLLLPTIISSLVVALPVFFILKLKDVIVSYEYFYYSLLVLFGLMASITFLFRSFIMAQVKRNYQTRKWTINTIIIGNGTNAIKMADELKKVSERNTILGFVTVDAKNSLPSEQIIGNFTHLDHIFSQHKIDEAIIALDNADEQKLFKYINALYRYNIEIRFTPRLYEILTGSARIGNLSASPLVSITNVPMSDWEMSVKRFFDFTISLVMIVLLLPVFLFFSIWIKTDSKGTVFYLQERIGIHGRPFNIIKFRTMYQDAETGQPRLSSPEDDRITNVGRILRKYRLDELPQFFNILKGEMSLVGPRPERKFYINQIIEDAPYYCLLYKIRPGLTSWGPIKIGYSDTIEKMIERLNYDIVYIENMSLINDLKILLFTIEIIFKGKGV
jgi:exopolysaccharide biosynthesis polyprenyl glycosylphosphotransferase